MRTGTDRIRHALGFEGLGLLLCIPLASALTGENAGRLGGVAVACSVAATGWNYLYNLLVDRWMLAQLGRLEKTWAERLAHAVCFELGLLTLTLPLMAWALSIGLLAALLLDIGFVVFYVIYAFCYNLAYDRLFPLAATPAAAGR